jgi:hypothetical protein
VAASAGPRGGTNLPGAGSTAWRDAGAGFNRSTEIGRRAGSVSQTLSDRARARALAAERPEPPASRGLVKRLFDWLREHVHGRGSIKRSLELVAEVTGSRLGTDAFLGHLRTRYGLGL